MNVLYTSAAYPPSIGGGEIHLHQLVARVAAGGCGVRVINQWSSSRSDWLRGATTGCRDAGTYRQDGIDVTRLGFSLNTRLRMWPWTRAYRRQWLRAASIEGVARLMAPYYESAARGNHDLVHALRIGCEFLPEVALRYCRRHDLPFVITALHHPGWVGNKFRHYDRIFRAASAVIALTESERKTLIQTKGVAAERVHVTGIGPILAPSYSVQAFRDRYDLRGPYVLFVGRKAPHKGWATLLQAAPRILADHTDAHIVFIGPDTRASETAFASTDIARVINLGAVDLATKTAAIAGCELLALPSTGESFGGVFTEAWSFAKPVVGIDIPSVACVVTDGTDGLLVAPKIGPLAEAVSGLLAHPGRAAELGANGLRKVGQRYGWDRIAEATLAIYREVTSSR